MLELDVAADGLDGGGPPDLALDHEIAGCGFRLEVAEAAAQPHVGCRGCDRGMAPVRYGCVDAELAAVPERDVPDLDGEAERALVPHRHRQLLAVELDHRLLERPLVSFECDDRLLAVDGFDDDLTGRDAHVDLDLTRGVKAMLGHLRPPGASGGRADEGSGAACAAA